MKAPGWMELKMVGRDAGGEHYAMRIRWWGWPIALGLVFLDWIRGRG